MLAIDSTHLWTTALRLDERAYQPEGCLSWHACPCRFAWNWTSCRPVVLAQLTPSSSSESCSSAQDTSSSPDSASLQILLMSAEALPQILKPNWLWSRCPWLSASWFCLVSVFSASCLAWCCSDLKCCTGSSSCLASPARRDSLDQFLFISSSAASSMSTLSGYAYCSVCKLQFDRGCNLD